MTTQEFLNEHGHVCRYCGGTATQRDHVVAKAMRRRHHIADSDVRYHVPSCGPCNWTKLTRKYYPPGFDVSLLPGNGWQLWRGGKSLEVVR